MYITKSIRQSRRVGECERWERSERSGAHGQKAGHTMYLLRFITSLRRPGVPISTRDPVCGNNGKQDDGSAVGRGRAAEGRGSDVRVSRFGAIGGRSADLCDAIQVCSGVAAADEQRGAGAREVRLRRAKRVCRHVAAQLPLLHTEEASPRGGWWPSASCLQRGVYAADSDPGDRSKAHDKRDCDIEDLAGELARWGHHDGTDLGQEFTESSSQVSVTLPRPLGAHKYKGAYESDARGSARFSEAVRVQETLSARLMLLVRLVRLVFQENLDERKDERERFARARARLDCDILIGAQQRDHGRLRKENCT